MGHEFVGVVEEVGEAVTTLGADDFVIGPFAVSCGTCEFCRAGLRPRASSGASGATGGTALPAARPKRSGCHWPTARW